MGGRGIAIVFIASFLGLTFSASPQTPGRIAGMVKDAQGTVIIGAQVSIENPATADKHSVTTDTSGNYSILQLPPGCVEHRTRYWAHAWVRERMSRLPLHKIEVLDAGSGTSNPLLDWYRPKVKFAHLLDLSPPCKGDNWELINCDLEKPLPFRDGSIDLITSVSSIEHLSAAGQLQFMSEARRILKPKGRLIMTVSYVCGLTPHALALIASDPVF